MWKIKHLLDENEKITELKSDIDLIDFVKKIIKENQDFDYSVLGISDAEEYIELYCGNLEIIEED